MLSSIFGDLVFDTGWKTKRDITIFNKHYIIVVKAKAYDETDGITREQEQSFNSFMDNEVKQLCEIEKMLIDFASTAACERFIPRVLLFLRDGSYAMLLDDKEDEDGGIAACLSPEVEIISQDEYL